MDMKNMESMMKTLMQNAQKIQENLKTASQEMAEKNKDRMVEGLAGIGESLVRVEMNLKLQVKKIHIPPALFNEGSEVVSEMIAAATNQAIVQAQEMLRKEMQTITQKMGLPKDMPMPFSNI